MAKTLGKAVASEARFGPENPLARLPVHVAGRWVLAVGGKPWVLFKRTSPCGPCFLTMWLLDSKGKHLETERARQKRNPFL